MNINTFHKTQAEIVSRFESGFSGYRGLAGPSCRKPSPIVEKILKRLSEKEKDLQRNNSIHSWATTTSSEISGIPSRFRLIDPNRPTLESIVQKVSKERAKSKLFKSAAHSVLRTKNRKWVKRQKDNAEEEDSSLGKVGEEYLNLQNLNFQTY